MIWGYKEQPVLYHNDPVSCYYNTDEMVKAAWCISKTTSLQVLLESIDRVTSKCYSQILCGRSAENWDFWLFCNNLEAKWWKPIHPEAELQDLFILAEVPIVWLITGSDNIFNIEINRHLHFANNMIVHNLLLLLIGAIERCCLNMNSPLNFCYILATKLWGEIKHKVMTSATQIETKNIKKLGLWCISSYGL